MSGLELLFLGTGTSSAVPSIGCLTNPRGCWCCRSTLSGDVEHQKNVRRNTSAILRIPHPDGRRRTILIDCGKTFFMGALEFWPKKGLREIDAVLLTHPHSDAIGGLDDLRGWTLGGHIQPTIPIYCSQFTFDEIQKSSPYLTDVSKATGGGDVPAFTWHVFNEGETFELQGIRVAPVPVHHGRFFTVPPQPYWCMGFVFDRRITYLSDVSGIPDSAWQIIEGECGISHGHALANGNTASPAKPRVLIIDALRLTRHASHFGLPQAIEAARRIAPQRTYLVGFAHRISHKAWVHALEAFERGERSSLARSADREPVPDEIWKIFNGHPDYDKEDVEVFKDHTLHRIESWEQGEKAGFWIRPACDGLAIKLDGDAIEDDVYGS